MNCSNLAGDLTLTFLVTKETWVFLLRFCLHSWLTLAEQLKVMGKMIKTKFPTKAKKYRKSCWRGCNLGCWLLLLIDHITSNSPSLGKESRFGARELLSFSSSTVHFTSTRKKSPSFCSEIPSRADDVPTCLSLNFDMAYVKDNLWLPGPRKVLAAGVIQLTSQRQVCFPLSFEDCDYN